MCFGKKSGFDISGNGRKYLYITTFWEKISKMLKFKSFQKPISFLSTEENKAEQQNK